MAYLFGSRVPLKRVEQFPDVVEKPKPSIFPDFPGIDPNLLQPNAPAGGVPAGPTAPTGGFGTPVSPPTNIIQSPTQGLDTVSTWWQTNPFLNRGSFSLYLEVIPFRWGGRRSTVPPPGITMDGKAFNFYFKVNGIPYAFSITDTDNDRVYEANIWKLKFDLGTGSTKYDFPFWSYQDFDEYAQSHKLVLPAAK